MAERNVWRVKLMKVGGILLTYFVAARDEAKARDLATSAYLRQGLPWTDFSRVHSTVKLGVLVEEQID